MTDQRAHPFPAARWVRTALAVALPLLAVAGCGGGDDPTGPDGLTVGDLAGRWTATVFEFSPAGGEAFPAVDLVAGGSTVVLEIEPDGRFVLTTTGPQGGAEVQPGRLRFDEEAEDFLLVTFDDDPGDGSEFFFARVGPDSFRLVDSTGEGGFDFDGDGAEEVARINSSWVRG